MSRGICAGGCVLAIIMTDQSVIKRRGDNQRPMGNMDQKTARQKNILEAARKVLLAADSANVTMESIAREAGVAKGTLFLYYPGKTALLAAVYSDLTKSFVSGLESIRDSGLRVEKLLRSAVKALVEHLAGKNALMDILGEKHRRRPCAKAPVILGALKTILEKCAADGLLTLEDPLYAASALFGLCRGSLAYSRGPGRSLSPADKAARVLEIYLYGLRARDKII